MFVQAMICFFFSLTVIITMVFVSNKRKCVRASVAITLSDQISSVLFFFPHWLSFPSRPSLFSCVVLLASMQTNNNNNDNNNNVAITDM